MKVYITGQQYEKIIETTASLDEIVVSGSIIEFFHSIEPRHTGSAEYSGSIHSTNDGEWFLGETYSFEEN
jgi:hypothetical protein|tara:strand:+ start:2126 stop:2335 length:210 start_codon:yes stop_codon:yes gene_type:complete